MGIANHRLQGMNRGLSLAVLGVGDINILLSDQPRIRDLHATQPLVGNLVNRHPRLRLFQVGMKLRHFNYGQDLAGFDPIALIDGNRC